MPDSSRDDHAVIGKTNDEIAPRGASRITKSDPESSQEDQEERFQPQPVSSTLG